jgi:hypothetical protein
VNAGTAPKTRLLQPTITSTKYMGSGRFGEVVEDCRGPEVVACRYRWSGAWEVPGLVARPLGSRITS